MPIAGEALILRILRWLRDSGVPRVVVNLHHRAETITRLVGDGSQIGLPVRYSWEAEVLGSAGGPARAIPLLEADRFLIVNGDTLTDVDLRALAAQHVDTNALVTMAVVDGDPRYNGVLADASGIVRGFGREPGACHFVGVQAVNAAAFAGVRPDARSETVHGIYPPLIAGHPQGIRIFPTGSRFFDIGSPRDYLRTALEFSARESRPHDRGTACSIAPDAVVEDTVIWDRVAIGARARLSRCVVADDVLVADGARYADCSLVMRGREMIATPL